MSSQRLFKLLPSVLPAVLVLFAPLGFAQAPAAAPIADESAAIAAAANAFMASGKAMNISADKLKELMANPATTPVLVSVCAPEHFAQAHVPGSINMPRGAFWKPPMLAKLPAKDRLVVTYCYTGTGAVGPATVLNLMGYNAAQLEWGMMGWSRKDVVLGPATRFPASQQKYPLVKGPQGTAVTYARPVVATGKATLEQVLIERADAVESADRTVSMTAEAVQELLADAMPGNDPFILDVRAPADFVRGHIEGAINVPAVGVYQAGNLAKLPTGRRIVVADYNGMSAVGISYVLATMGYDARGLQMGMMGWSTDDAVMGPFKRFPADQRDYPIAKK